MELNRYLSILRKMLIAGDEVGHETSTKTLIRLTMQFLRF